MGVFNVPISVGDSNRQEWTDLTATVNTETYMSAVPASVLRTLGLSPNMRGIASLADGTERNVDIAYTWLRVDSREIMTHIIFNEENTGPLLGSLALETLLLVVDPSGERLVPLLRFPL